MKTPEERRAAPETSLSTSTEPFHILESTDDGRRVITPCGELDLSTEARLEERLRGKIDTILDLSELSFIDSAGIRLLFLTTRRAQREAWEFTIRDPQPAILRVIKLVALDQYLGLDGHMEPPAPVGEEPDQPGQTTQTVVPPR